jgi:DNA-binding NarL/FixJ family response regulator
MSKSPLILVLEDDQFARHHTMSLLTGLFPDYTSQCTHNLREAITQTKAQKPVLLLLDLHLSDGSLSAHAIPQFKRASPESKILIVSNERRDLMLANALNLGADGILTKEAPQQLPQAVEYLLANHNTPFLLHPNAFNIMRALFFHPVISALNAREMELFILYGSGLKPKGICALIPNITAKTISNQLIEIRKKLGLTERTALVEKYLRLYDEPSSTSLSNERTT